MAGINELSRLLKEIAPQLDSTPYVFCTVDKPLLECLTLDPIATFVEHEGLTLVVKQSVADAHELAYSCVMNKITLQVHSSLEAVGLTAAFSNALKEVNVSANVFAGFYHDHIFVPADDASKAISAIQNLAT
ncbi:ACT domain-containing protein [Pseudoalteromonas sp. McH1-7]|uniref:ACT domain-containing protein n=1 Tax=Pseudoalteromonas TaxID=53246 RepID=UPI001590C5DF|nr:MULTISPECIES: ACT domain-containing protein [Pseudoalteromonas]MDW7548270.1 ACT domain-containing protein [Pseudoalteromonas peptidolytica]NUZ10371.1 ACT domain-containing protein [Pseudoalteromonas sp. McH1-7]USD27177.1 ACT domain-containing protein [Pseudoalteromonas sp. SCSIO 43201]